MTAQLLPHADARFILMSDFDGTITARVCFRSPSPRSHCSRPIDENYTVNQDSNDTATDDVSLYPPFSRGYFRLRLADAREHTNSSALASTADESSMSTS